MDYSVSQILGCRSLTPHPLPPPLLAGLALFLLSTYNITSVSSLHGNPPYSSDEDDPMLATLHSFISSLSSPPLAPSTALEHHQLPKGKNPIFIWVLQIESNHHRRVDIHHIAK
ncbi:hypothetical protein AAC387_Pa03g3136 [Persea americana]